MTDFAAEEDRTGELADRLNDAEGVLVPRSDAYQRINDAALKEEDEDNPESAPRGEEKCRVDDALDMLEKAQRQLNSTTPPSDDVLDGIEQAVEHIEAVIRDTPADEADTRTRGWDDDDMEELTD